ncbi:MAG: fumarylacetoacetate hydrolase family protein [Caulobacteraceae bacterium]
MRLATLRSEAPDGRLVVVSADGRRFLPAQPQFSSLQAALDDWRMASVLLGALAARLEVGAGSALEGHGLAAPLPRAWQWLDASAYPSHGELMQKLFGGEPHSREIPLMYQGVSNPFLGPTDDLPLPREADGIDFEGEFAVIVDHTPMGVSVAAAADHIKLLVQVNDWSLRNLAWREMQTGFGWIQAKPACSMAPFAVTPEDLGEHWRDGRVHLDLTVSWNGKRFGAPNGGAMGFSFPELVAHAAATRPLCAGTVIGSGTVSNSNYVDVGSSCIAELRAIEKLGGHAMTEFMRFGDRVRMEAVAPNGGLTPFGAIDQIVVQAPPAA